MLATIHAVWDFSIAMGMATVASCDVDMVTSPRGKFEFDCNEELLLWAADSATRALLFARPEPDFPERDASLFVFRSAFRTYDSIEPKKSAMEGDGCAAPLTCDADTSLKEEVPTVVPG